MVDLFCRFLVCFMCDFCDRWSHYAQALIYKRIDCMVVELWKLLFLFATVGTFFSEDGGYTSVVSLNRARSQILFCAGMKMFRLFRRNFYLVQSSNCTSKVNNFCHKLFTLKDNIFIWLITASPKLAILYIFSHENFTDLLKPPSS